MLTVAQWQHWEYRRYIDAGKFGYFDAAEVAAWT